ncbi:MAG TPA: DUF4870 domain-containing protein [Pseudogracilibacillus sp.]|nr:DUF4870 domain-containing protein [Pseudogracilibacillus sp.]
MAANKLLSSLSYFSLFFAPFLFPLIVYFLTEDDTKKHAKRAFLSHIIPAVLIVLAMIMIIIVDMNSIESSPILLILWLIVTAIITLVMYIWNIIQGIKVLIN